MRFFSTLCVLAASVPTCVSAFEISRDYDISFGEFADLDKTCLDALESDIVPVFEGFNGVQLPLPSFLQGSDDRGTLVTYAGVTFESEFNDAKGTLNCIYEGGSGRIWAVSVVFEGRGLAGFKKHPLAKKLNDPAKLRATGFASEL